MSPNLLPLERPHPPHSPSQSIQLTPHPINPQNPESHDAIRCPHSCCTRQAKATIISLLDAGISFLKTPPPALPCTPGPLPHPHCQQSHLQPRSEPANHPPPHLLTFLLEFLLASSAGLPASFPASPMQLSGAPSPCMLALPGIPCHAYLPGEFPNHPSRFSSAITSSVKPSQLSPSRAGHPSSVVPCPSFHAAAPALTTPVLVCLDI